MRDDREHSLYACQECGQLCGDEIHRYFECLVYKRNHGTLTPQDTAALWKYAERGAAAYDAERTPE